MGKIKSLDWIHWLLILIVGALVWSNQEDERTLRSAEQLIVAQKSALESSNRALDSTVEYKAFKSPDDLELAVEVAAMAKRSGSNSPFCKRAD